MTTPRKDLELGLLETDDNKFENTNNTVPAPVTWQFEYKSESNAPKVPFSGLVLIILCPLLICAHIRASNLAQIPLIQFGFVTTLFAFLVNYTAVIRKYQIRPFLPESIYDNKLKRMCVMAVLGMIISIIWGWNGSGGILFAMGWESIRGNRMGFYGYMLIIIVAGSLLMEQNFAWKKLIEFIPGVFFGSINATLFTLRESSIYAIAHQFLLLSAVALPMLFPAFHIVVPSLWQWLLMLGCGLTILVTTVLTVRLMQTERVSVVMGVMSGIMMVGTCDFNSSLDFIGTAIIVAGVALVLKKQYIDLHY